MDTSINAPDFGGRDIARGIRETAQEIDCMFSGDRLQNGSPYSVCLSCPVTFVYCVQTVGWIKVKLGTDFVRDACLGPGHVLDGDPSPLQRGTAPRIFGPYLLFLDGWIDQDAIW